MTTPLRYLERLKLKPTGVVHVGASDGQEVEDYAGALDSAVFIEPLAEQFARLTGKIAGRPGMIPVQALCADTDGAEVQLNIASNNGESSSILAPAAHKALHAGVLFETSQTMRTTKLDTLLRDLRVGHGAVVDKIDTLVLDVQGAEMIVLKGAVDTLRQIDFLYAEVAHMELYAGNARFYDLIDFLKVFDLHLFWCQLNAKFYGDALFVRMSRLPGYARGVAASA